MKSYEQMSDAELMDEYTYTITCIDETLNTEEERFYLQLEEIEMELGNRADNGDKEAAYTLRLIEEMF